METIKVDRVVTINVDVQNDFCPGGSLAVPEGNQVIGLLNTLNADTRLHGGMVVATGDQHPLETPHFGPDAWPVHCVAGTFGAELHRDLDIRPEDILVDKGMGQTDGYSGFEGVARDGRTLEEIIQPAGREQVAVLLGGLATDYCVLNTAIDALKVNPDQGRLHVFAVTDAMRGVNINPNDSANSLDTMQAAGAHLVTTEEILTRQAFELAK